MAAEHFENNSLDWQLQQLGRRVGEWIELRLPRSGPNLPDVPRWSFPSWWLEAAFWLVVMTATLWLGWQLYRWLSPYFSSVNQQYGRFLDRQGSPPEQERTIAEWIRQVQEFQRQGNYREACRALYMAMLQRLNDANLVPKALSLTDGEYWRLVQVLPQSQAYQTLLRTHEQLCFGNAPISVETFNRCQEAYGDIERATTN